MPTLFERIISGELPAKIVHRDDRVTAFRDIRPRAPTHILIVPNKVIATANDITNEDEALVGHMFTVARDLAKQEGIAAGGYRLIVNCGDHAGMEVPHLHVHLLGGKPLGPMIWGERMKNQRRELYPSIKPYRKGFLKVSAVHELYYEESGNPKGKPAVFLHGGPGGGTDPKMRRFFDPKRYRIVLFDQRGCGKSRPHASLEHNTTWDLVADIEKLREHLQIEKWLVFGGSWGSTLALAYAQTHPERCTELVLRGIFLLRRFELEWFYQNERGTAMLYPDLWKQYVAIIPPAERGNMIQAYYKRLTSNDRKELERAAKAWSVWEGATSFLHLNPHYVAKFGDARFAAAFARIECHYFVNGGFLRSENELIEKVNRIRHIPAVIVQGRYDIVCPMKSAWDLHEAWPEADLRITPDAGHSAFEPGNLHELIRATDRFAGRATRRSRAR